MYNKILGEIKEIIYDNNIDIYNEIYEKNKKDINIKIEKIINIIKKEENINKIRLNIIVLIKWKIDKYNNKIEEIKNNNKIQNEIIKKNKLNDNEIREYFPMYNINNINMITINNIINILKNKINIMEDVKYNNILINNINDILDNKKYGINNIKGNDRKEIVYEIIKNISTLVNGSQGFMDNFNNYIISGDSGVGKTYMAYIISHIYTKIGILATDNIVICSKQNLVASYLGQTGLKTVRQLYNSIEGVLVIDEAYQLSGCGDICDKNDCIPNKLNPKPDQYGLESITEIINFLDKNINFNIVIACGYYDHMKYCFLNSNPGMSRRFPNFHNLYNYTSYELFNLLLNFIQHKNLSINNINIIDYCCILLFIHFLNIKYNIFNYQAGDIKNLSNIIINNYLSPDNIISLNTINIDFILLCFKKFLINKSHNLHFNNININNIILSFLVYFNNFINHQS
jgi:hypothetical protein